MKKRLFEVLDEMNVSDINNNTRLVQVSGNFISGGNVKQGGKVEMGVPKEALTELFNDEVLPVLLLVNKKEYARLTKEA